MRAWEVRAKAYISAHLMRNPAVHANSGVSRNPLNAKDRELASRSFVVVVVPVKGIV